MKYIILKQQIQTNKKTPHHSPYREFLPGQWILLQYYYSSWTFHFISYHMWHLWHNNQHRLLIYILFTCSTYCMANKVKEDEKRIGIHKTVTNEQVKKL